MGLCDMPGGIRQDRLEKVVWEQVTQALLDPDNLRRELDRQRNTVEAQAQERRQQVAQTEAELAEVDRKLRVLLDQILVQGFPEELIQGVTDALLVHREQLVQKSQRLQSEMENGHRSAAEEQSLLAHLVPQRFGQRANQVELFNWR